MTDKVPGSLVIVRHGESEWNALGLWTGFTDVKLSPKGHIEGAKMGELITDIKFDRAFVSTLIRSQQTLDEILKVIGQTDIPKIYADAVKERDYGDYTGKNKWEIRDTIGEEAFNSLRRNWNYPVPNGETLKDVYARTVPYYLEQIVPLLQLGENIILAAHGNSIRALVKYIEHISDDEIANFEMTFGQVLVYTVDNDGYELTKEVRQIETAPTPA